MGERFGREITFVAFSLDPEHDTPEAFRGYAERYGITDGWTFLTGDVEALDRIRRQLGFYDLDPVLDADRTQHSGALVIGNEPRARWMHMPASLAPETIVDAFRRVQR